MVHLEELAVIVGRLKDSPVNEQAVSVRIELFKVRAAELICSKKELVTVTWDAETLMTDTPGEV